jgi:hypothetical protein
MKEDLKISCSLDQPCSILVLMKLKSAYMLYILSSFF